MQHCRGSLEGGQFAKVLLIAGASPAKNCESSPLRLDNRHIEKWSLS